jgi:plasmid stability protein
MSEILIRNLEPKIVQRLKQRAVTNHRSLQAEAKDILESAVEVQAEDILKITARMRRKLAGRHHTDSAELLAEDRRR